MVEKCYKINTKMQEKIINEIVTERLRFRKIEAKDSQAFFDTWASDDFVTQYLTWPSHKNVDMTKMVVDMWLKEYQENESCFRYGLVLKDTNELIGMIDVVGMKEDCPVIGYVLGRKYWSQGYMTEAFLKTIDLLFKKGYAGIFIEADERNIGSNKIIRKNGFEFIEKETKVCSSLKPEIVTVNWYKRVRDK